MTIGRFGHDPSKGPNPDFLVFMLHYNLYVFKHKKNILMFCIYYVAYNF